MANVNEVYISDTGNCWLVEQLLNGNRAMVRRIAIADAAGTLHTAECLELNGPYCFPLPIIGRRLAAKVSNLAGWIV